MAIKCPIHGAAMAFSSEHRRLPPHIVVKAAFTWAAVKDHLSDIERPCLHELEADLGKAWVENTLAPPAAPGSI
jgi:hypothetical protein